MKPLVFLLKKTIKNSIRDLFYHPSKLICYLLLIAVVGFSLVANLLFPTEVAQSYTDLRVLQAIYFALLTGFFVIGCMTGISKGGSFFKMADVNFLFTAPLSSRKILIYGLVRSLGTTLALSLFILCYGSMIQQNFGISPASVFLLMAGYLVTLFSGQVMAVMLYSFCSGNIRRKQGVKAMLIGLLALLAGYLWYTANQAGGLSLENLLDAVTKRIVLCFPFSGWATGAVFGSIAGSVTDLLLFSALVIVGICGLIVCFMAYQPDYYEDVLQNTESAFSVQQAAKEGRIVEQKKQKLYITKKDRGLRHGSGASVFFYKQLKEKHRTSMLVFFDLFSVIALLICIFLPMIFQDKDNTANERLGIALIAAVYLLFFSNAAGSWSKEMTKPYLYLAPEPSWKKLLWATAPSLLKPLAEGIVAFGAGGAIAGASFQHIVVFVLIYFSFGAVFTTVNLASQRLFGQMANRGLLLLFYMLFLVILLSPGAVAAAIMMFVVGIPKIVAVLPVLVWNLAVSGGIYLLCRNSLHTMEI